ncbi:MAG TPA: GAF domain-containing protein [Thermoanaerobaculia bacterium]
MSDAGERGGAPGRLETSGLTGGDLVDQLRATLDRAGELVRVLEENLGVLSRATAAAGGGESRVSELEQRLHSAEADVKELAGRLVDSEHQAGRLMNLYVATYQLHSTLDPDEVQQTIAEIASNLLGARSFVLLLAHDGPEDGCDVALAEGVEGDERWQGTYRGGDPVVDATLADGILRLGAGAGGAADGGGELVAAVPLRVQQQVVGALVVLRLLDHKPILRPEDRDLLDLLSAHAASALFAARLYAAKERKVKSLQSLVELARGETP